MGGIRIAGRVPAGPTIGVPYAKFVSGESATTIWHVPFAGGAPAQITAPTVGADHESPVVDPVGRTRLVYLDNQGGEEYLRIVNVDGSGDTLVDAGDHRAIDWHPDGSVIAFTTYNDGELHQILTIEPDGSNRQAIYSASSVDDWINRPVYSHDGTRIAFNKNISTPGPSWEVGEVWVIDADGSNPTKIDDIYSAYYLEYTAGWSHDDTMLGYGDGGNSFNEIPAYPGVPCGRWYVKPSDGSGSRLQVGNQLTGGYSGSAGAEAESAKLGWLPDDSGIIVPQWTNDNRWSVKICQADGSGEALLSPTFRVFDRPVWCFENDRIYAVAYEEPVFTSITFDSVAADGSDRRVEDPSGINILLELFT